MLIIQDIRDHTEEFKILKIMIKVWSETMIINNYPCVNTEPVKAFHRELQTDLKPVSLSETFFLIKGRIPKTKATVP